MRKYTRFFLTSFLLICFFFLENSGAKDFSANKLGSIIALEDGRKKPLETYAQNKLLQFSGKRKLKGKTAIEWFASLIFNPQSCDFEPIFLINNPSTVQTLG
ncbi:MAG: hypothetical protein N2053_01485, partial [Chitinispirillaceae bacterium]|nr:hypothetical protein [Chitinispirillaceae bacterium]